MLFVIITEGRVMAPLAGGLPWLPRDACRYSSTISASKFGKFSSGHRTGKGQFSFQSQRKAMPKNDPITTQLHLSHMLVK